MKILLVGELSGVHSNFGEGLEALGHKVTHLSLGDGYKSIEKKNTKIFRRQRGSILEFLAIELKKFIFLLRLKQYDVVQFQYKISFASILRRQMP